MKIKSRKKSLMPIFIAIYISIVYASYYYVYISDRLENLLLFVIPFFALTWFGSVLLLEYISSISIPIKEKKHTKKALLLVFFLTFTICFMNCMIWYFGYYPGNFSNDSFWQLRQAISGQYNDWHPVWQTIITFTIPIKLFRRPEWIPIIQSIFFSCAVGFMGLVAYKNYGIKWTIGSEFFIILNPYISIAVMFPWKDVTFAISCLFSATIAIDMYHDDLHHFFKAFFLGIMLAQASLFRHNGVLFTLVLLIGVLLCVKSKKWIIIGSFLLTILLIRNVLYPIINVEYPGNRITEISGLPMTVIGNVAKEAPEKLDEELSEFVFSVAPKETWDNMTLGNFNTVKWTGIDMSKIEEKGFLGMLRMTLKCFYFAPKESYKALISLTDLLYGIETGNKGGIWCELATNEFGIIRLENETISSFLKGWDMFTGNTFLKYFRSYGIWLLVIIMCLLSRSKQNGKRNWGKRLIVLSLVTYDFGTMLLLSGWDSRFFLVTFLVGPIYIMFTLSDTEVQGMSNE